QFTTAGLLAMAKSTDDTNDSQIFVTAQPVRFLDFQPSIFGVLTEGDAVRTAIQKSSATDTTTANIAITSAQIASDTQNAALARPSPTAEERLTLSTSLTTRA